jgi:hypothetical protein
VDIGYYVGDDNRCFLCEHEAQPKVVIFGPSRRLVSLSKWCMAYPKRSRDTLHFLSGPSLAWQFRARFNACSSGGRIAPRGSDRPDVRRLQGDADCLQRETLERSYSLRAGHIVALCKLLDKLLGAGPRCAVQVKRDRAELESMLSGRKAVPG